MTVRLTLVLVVALAAAAGPARAQIADAASQARQSGVLGERYDGYLGFAAAPSEQVRRLAGSINIKRRSLYTGLAARRNATVQEVGIAAGCELLATVKVGQAYMLNDGQWRRRAAGEAAPVPSYCSR